MKLAIRHTTRYRFAQPAAYGVQQVRKRPKSTSSQEVHSWALEVSGATLEATFQDHHRNTVDLLSFERGTTEIELVVRGEVSVTDTAGILGRHLGPAPLWLYERTTPLTRAGAGVRKLVAALPEGETLERLHALTRAVHAAIAYVPGASRPDWSAEDALAEGRGVCQDHAHAFIAAARLLGCPARYVSGYLMLQERIEQEAMHAWAEAHVEGLGWVGFDPANGISPDARYVRVATGLDYTEAAPVTGLRIGGAGELLDVEIAVAQQQ